MLRSDRQLRTQIHQLMDGALFAIGFWLAHWMRAQTKLDLSLFGFNLLGDASNAFAEYNWLYFVIGFTSLLILEAQGFYKRPFFVSRRVRPAKLGPDLRIAFRAKRLFCGESHVEDS